MIAKPLRRRFVRASGLLTALGLCALVALTACDRGKDTHRGTAASKPGRATTQAAPRPEYAFAPGLEERNAEVVGFLRTFLETALAGDYAGYRRLVSRVADPESRSRFEKILNSLSSLTVESIEPLESSQVPPPAFVVLSRVEFLPDRRVSLRRKNNNRIAIIVFREEEEWRMIPAPPALQPEAEPETPTTSTTTSAPSYPWQEDADY
jgi:hypothetical protein